MSDRRCGGRALFAFEVRVRVRCVALVLLAALELAWGGRVRAQEVVVNPGVRVEALSRNEARAIFGMRLRRWPDGSRIVVFTLPDGAATHVDFAKSRLEIFPHQLRRAWDRLVFSGTGQEPIEVPTEQAMRARVSSTAGAIGYLRRENVDATVRLLPIR